VHVGCVRARGYALVNLVSLSDSSVNLTEISVNCASFSREPTLARENMNN
jgi:hypothetical protein